MARKEIEFEAEMYRWVGIVDEKDKGNVALFDPASGTDYGELDGNKIKGLKSQIKPGKSRNVTITIRF